MMKVQKYYFSTFIISNSKIEILVSFSRSTNVNVNMPFPSSNFVGNISSYVFRNSFWYYRELKIDCWKSQLILCEKILNIFVVLQVRILVEKWNVYEGHIFPRSFLQTCRFETISWYLNTNLLAKKNFQILIILIEIN